MGVPVLHDHLFLLSLLSWDTLPSLYNKGRNGPSGQPPRNSRARLYQVRPKRTNANSQPHLCHLVGLSGGQSAIPQTNWVCEAGLRHATDCGHQWRITAWPKRRRMAYSPVQDSLNFDELPTGKCRERPFLSNSTTFSHFYY